MQVLKLNPYNSKVLSRREAPMPPLEGEVVERQRNRRGLYVNRAVKPLSQPVRAASSLFRGAEGASRRNYTTRVHSVARKLGIIHAS